VTLPGSAACATAAAAAGAAGWATQGTQRRRHITAVAGHFLADARLRQAQRLRSRHQLRCLIGDVHRQRGCMCDIVDALGQVMYINITTAAPMTERCMGFAISDRLAVHAMAKRR
jgi:hypothetical protein